MTDQPKPLIVDLVGHWHRTAQYVVMTLLRSHLWSVPALGLGPRNSDPWSSGLCVYHSDNCSGNIRVIVNR